MTNDEYKRRHIMYHMKKLNDYTLRNGGPLWVRYCNKLEHWGAVTLWEAVRQERLIFTEDYLPYRVVIKDKGRLQADNNYNRHNNQLNMSELDKLYAEMPIPEQPADWDGFEDERYKAIATKSVVIREENWGGDIHPFRKDSWRDYYLSETPLDKLLETLR